jgi:hypothetical protein
MKVAEALPQWLIHPEYKFSQSPRHTAFQLANNTTKPFFEWMKDNNDYLGPFAASVEVSLSSSPSDSDIPLAILFRQSADMRPREYYQTTHGKLAWDRQLLIAAGVVEA